MGRLAQDIRLALRGFRRSPTFAVTAVVVLGIAIGMAVAMTTVFNAVLVQRLPMRDAQRVVELWPFVEQGSEFAVDPGVTDALNRQSNTIAAAASIAHYGAIAFPLLDGDRSVVMPSARVSGNFFAVIGARPALGRLLRPEDDVPGAGHVMVISYAAWQQEFGGDSTIVGRQLKDPADAGTFTIVGVAPAGLDYPTGAGCWVALAPLGYRSVHVVARLAPAATPAAARTEFLSVASHLAPGNKYRGAEVHGLPDLILGNVRPLLWVLAAAVALLLLIACANVANLLMLRAVERTRELGVRRALGASYGMLVRQLLVESCALGLAGGVIGLVTAQWLLHALVDFAPMQLPRTDVVRLAGVPIVTTLVFTCVSIAIFGLGPALLGARAGGESSLRLGVRGGRETRRSASLKQGMVAAQLALTLLLLVGTSLLAHTLERLERLNLGYAASHLAILQLALPGPKIGSTAKLMTLMDDLYPRVRAIPGVTALTPVLMPPFLGQNVWRWDFEAEGQSPEEAARNPRIPVEMGGPEYFQTFGTPIVRGRGFLDTDRSDAPLVVVVSASVAQRFWPGEDPLGKRIRVADRPEYHDPTVRGGVWRTVVGVASETRFRSLRDATPMLYMPWRQSITQGWFAVRTSGDLGSVLPAVRRVIHDVEPDMSLWRTQTMDEELAGPLAQPRLGATLMSAFGIASLLLAAIGLYGVMASSVRERTREIGVKMALGATHARVRDEVLRRAFRTFAIGGVVGLAGALVASRLLTSLLFEVSPADPIAFLSACSVLCVVALAAAYIPARRATRVDPVQALRAE